MEEWRCIGFTLRNVRGYRLRKKLTRRSRFKVKKREHTREYVNWKREHAPYSGKWRVLDSIGPFFHYKGRCATGVADRFRSHLLLSAPCDCNWLRWETAAGQDCIDRKAIYYTDSFTPWPLSAHRCNEPKYAFACTMNKWFSTWLSSVSYVNEALVLFRAVSRFTEILATSLSASSNGNTGISAR